MGNRLKPASNKVLTAPMLARCRNFSFWPKNILRVAIRLSYFFYTVTTAIQNQTAVAGISRNIHIPCDLREHKGTSFWSINDTIYEAFSIPQYFPSIPVITKFGVLTISSVTPDLNNVVFLCASFDDSGNLRSTPEGATRLIVFSSKWCLLLLLK